jgi:hypothetical protein
MGGSRDFENSGHIVQVSNYSAIENIFSGGGNFSVWLFVRSVGNGTTAGTIWSKRLTSSAPAGRIHMSGENLIRVIQFYEGSSNYTQNTTNNSITLNNWFHLSINYNKDVFGNEADFFIDGEPFPSNVFTWGSSSEPRSDSARPLTMGSIEGGTLTFDGLIAYPHMYDRELTQPEIKEIMHKPGSIRDGLVGFWPFTDDGSTQRNLSGIGNTGSVTGATSSDESPPISKFL